MDYHFLTKENPKKDHAYYVKECLLVHSKMSCKRLVEK